MFKTEFAKDMLLPPMRRLIWLCGSKTGGALTLNVIGDQTDIARQTMQSSKPCETAEDEESVTALVELKALTWQSSPSWNAPGCLWSMILRDENTK
jgi:hypothetical protein